VRDFDWGNEAPQNRRQVVRDALGGEYEAFRSALDIAEADNFDQASTTTSAPDISPFLLQVQSAGNKAELTNSLTQFDAQLDGLLDPLRRLARKLPAVDGDAEWARATTSRLLRDPAFRAGGARRIHLTAAEQLRGIGQLPQVALQSVADVVAACASLFGRRIDPGPALGWIRDRTYSQMRQVVRGAFGSRAGDLAQQCEEQVRVIEELQKAVAQESDRLGHTQRQVWEPPQDAWLLDVEDIDDAISAGKAPMVEAVSGAVCDELASELSRADLSQGATALRSFFEREFHEAAMRALEREAVKLTKRPSDSVARVRQRMERCEPMAQLVSSGPEFLRVMAGRAPATPLRFVLTALEGPEREQLQQWARAEAARAGDHNAFQVLQSDDQLRDDALTLHFGWPLWLFAEVRTCHEALERAKSHSPELVAFSRTLLELDILQGHDFAPLPTKRSTLLFAYALVMNEIRPVREDRVVFQQATFGTLPDASSLDSARAIFSRSGMNRTYMKRLDGDQTRPGFVEGVRVQLAARRAELERGVPASLNEPLEQAIRAVEEDLTHIMPQ
jgi:hypothetical protein